MAETVENGVRVGTCNVAFHPAEAVVAVPPGTDLLAAAIDARVQIYSSCGGDGVCGHCRVIVRDGEVDSEPSTLLTQRDVDAGYVLACRTFVHGDVEVEVPPETRSDSEQILTRDAVAGRVASLIRRPAASADEMPIDEHALSSGSGLSTKLFLDLPPPTLEDPVSDLDRLCREIRRVAKLADVRTPIGILRDLTGLLRDADWRVTVTLARRGAVAEVLVVESGDTTGRNLGVALDVGTTTVVASLLDLNNGITLGTAATHNPQRAHGEDVISRLVFAEQNGGLNTLRDAATDAANGLIASLLEEHGLRPDDVTAVVCTGNTTMIHLLLGIDPYYLRRDPYVPTANTLPVVRACEARLDVNPGASVGCVSGVSSYVGGDITAGILASGLDTLVPPSVLIDLGTNGEIAIGNREWLVCCSASAGPAFEGSGVRCGTRASRGAVQAVTIDATSNKVYCATIGDAAPIGICGSGYIEALAELFRSGIVDRQGALRPGNSDSVRTGPDGPEFVLVRASDSGTGRDIVITQTDIDILIRSKGSVFSAAKILVGKVGLRFEDVDKIYIGGGFGNYLNVEKAIWIGLLPDLPHDRFEFIGNSSLAGAKMVLLSHEAQAKSQEIADRMTNIELCTEAAYMGEYVGSLFLPHTDVDLFPTVKQHLEG